MFEASLVIYKVLGNCEHSKIRETKTDPCTVSCSLLGFSCTQDFFRNQFSWETEAQRGLTHSGLTVRNVAPTEGCPDGVAALCILPPTREILKLQQGTGDGTWQTGLMSRRFPSGQAGPSQAVGKSRQA